MADPADDVTLTFGGNLNFDPLGALDVAERLAGEGLERLVAWWREELAGAPTALELPTDFPRPPVQTFTGGWVEQELSAGQVEHLLALSRRQGTTLFITLLAVFQSLLHRLAGQDDLLVGAPVAYRPLPAMADALGFYVDTLVLRSTFRAAESFGDFLQRRKVCARTKILACAFDDDGAVERAALDLAHLEQALHRLHARERAHRQWWR